MAIRKVCSCCHTKANTKLQRVCKRCGVPAIWRAPNCDEIAAETARVNQFHNTLKELMGEEWFEEMTR